MQIKIKTIKIRRPAVAGNFYPENKTELEKQIETFLNTAKTLEIKPKALIVPHAGYIYSGSVAATGFKQLENLENQKQNFEKRRWKVILLGPSHYYPFAGLCFADYDFWETPLGKIRTIKPKISENIFEFTEAHEPEHCLEVQLPFLQKTLLEFSILPLLVGEIDPDAAAEELLPYFDESVILVVSSDLSHYHSYEKAKAIDNVANKAIPNIDLDLAKKIEACGKIPILIALHIAKKLGWKGRFLDYKTSGDTGGPRDRVVGYGAYVFS
ncbi:MAG: AmmeMemoRadiSam system protein B [Candidatus Nanoarchaeia archaeon]